MKEIAAAVIRRDGRLLLCRRAERPGDSCAGLWEFPGGKREPGKASRIVSSGNAGRVGRSGKTASRPGTNSPIFIRKSRCV